MPRLTSVLCAVGCALCSPESARHLHAQPGGDVPLAVVVGRDSPVAQLTLDQLRRLFLGQTATLPTGQAVRVIIHRPSAAAFDRRALAVTEAAVKRRWVAAVFRGEAQATPTEMDTADEVKRHVASHANALAYIPVTDVDASVRVVRIGGRQPGDADYPVR